VSAVQFLVLHGPNLNLFGRREPHIYGSTTLAQIDAEIQSLASELGANVICFQSNHEGALVDKLQEHIDDVDGALLNPGGLTQHGVSLHDCIKAMPFPVIEVHLSNIHAREEWRSHSIITPAAKGTILGLGWRGYLLGLRALVQMAAERAPS
jgi:3-dehydroquinate dehydratase-2